MQGRAEGSRIAAAQRGHDLGAHLGRVVGVGRVLSPRRAEPVELSVDVRCRQAGVADREDPVERAAGEDGCKLLAAA